MSPGCESEASAFIEELRRLAVVTGKRATEVETRAAEILRSRIEKRSGIDVITRTESEFEGGTAVLIGVPGNHDSLSRLMEEFGADLPRLPDNGKEHPEGFTVWTGGPDGERRVLIAGTDERGCIYGAGEFLRGLTYRSGDVVVPMMRVKSRPAFWMRGGNPSGPGSRARRFGNLRPRTEEEHREAMEDIMLLGTNIFGGDPELVRSYGMMTRFGRTANSLRETDTGSPIPQEWRSPGDMSGRYVCPSIPEARVALLDSFEEMFREAADYDFFTTNSGDTGGCRCERCMPWGRTYIELVEEIAERLHRYHPECRVLATNQDLTNEGNQLLFDYLDQVDSSWLYAIRYGPGADEMQTYIRGPVNPRWFEYEGFGSMGNFLKHMHHELPRETNIALYTDITHWMQSQFAVQRPDVVLAAIYGRRSWNARPRKFHRVAREILHYAVGDMHYSEGMHDDFNKWFWYRMLWDPHLTAEEITAEYCRYWFGPEAAEDASEAIYLMEETLSRPVIGNDNIPRAVDLLRKVGERIPENLLKDDHRWRVMTQKALMDLYIKMKVERGEGVKRRASAELEMAVGGDSPAEHLETALEILRSPLVTDEMGSIKDEAMKLGEESNRVIGYRVPTPFIVDDYDVTEVEWWRRTIEDALGTGSESRMRNASRMILDYDDPGPGGYYDNLGWPHESDHITHGETLWGFMPFPGPALLSHYSLAFSWGDERTGVTLRYRDLEPDTSYMVRISVGVHVMGTEIPIRPGDLREALAANGRVIDDGFEVPVGEIGMREFRIPRELTGKGDLKISLLPRVEGLPVTGACEVWLMREDSMPWRADL